MVQPLRPWPAPPVRRATRDLPPWAWRLSGKAGGTGTGFAVEYKTRPAERWYPAPDPPHSPEAIECSTERDYSPTGLTCPHCHGTLTRADHYALGEVHCYRCGVDYDGSAPAARGPKSRANPALRNPITR